MATLIKETGSGVTGANTYQTEAEADAYFADNPYATTWDAGTSATKSDALAYAAVVVLQDWFRWVGQKADDTNALPFPRFGVLKQNEPFYYDSDEVPAVVVRAQAEVAQAILAGTITGPSDLSGREKIKLGPLEIETENKQRQDHGVPTHVLDMLQGLGRLVGAGLSINTVFRS